MWLGNTQHGIADYHNQPYKCISPISANWVLYGALTIYELLISSQAIGAISSLKWICGGKTVWLLIRWLLMKPADLESHCFQNNLDNFEKFFA